MKQQKKFSQEQQHEEIQHTPSHVGREFASAEEMLRFDASKITVPPEIAQRLQQSACHLPPPRTGWLRRIFGGNP
jgi:hypothetical protein